MRIILPHQKTKEAAMRDVDQAIVQVFQPMAGMPFEIVDPHKSWVGQSLTFSLVAKIGFIRNAIHGTAVVSDHDIDIDVDLGGLGKLLGEAKVRSAVESRFKGLLT